MTFRDRLKEEYPNRHKDLGDGLPIGCPAAYGYETHCIKECPSNDISCQDCWDREIPEASDTENELDDVSIWPEVAILLSFLGVIFVIAISQMF